MILKALVFLLGTGLPTGSAKDVKGECAAPHWFDTIASRHSKSELVAAGKGPTITAARLAARKALARAFVLRHNETFALPNVRGQVNRKIYRNDELTEALAAAVASIAREPKRLEEDVVCDSRYVALSMVERDLAADIKKQEDLGELMNLALTGHTDDLEVRRHHNEDDAMADQFATPDATVVHLRQLAATLDNDLFLEAQMRAALMLRAEHIDEQLQAARALEWPDKRAAAATEVEELALASEPFIDACRALAKQDLTKAFTLFRTMAKAGDEASQLLTGYMLAEGIGSKRNDLEAVDWLRRAANQSNGPAKVMLGLMLFAGRGSRPDTAEAMKWISSATVDGWSCTTKLMQCRRR